MIKNKIRKHRLINLKFPGDNFCVDIPQGMTTYDVKDVLVEVFGVVSWDKVLGEGSLIEYISGNTYINDNWTLIINFVNGGWGDNPFHYRTGWLKNPRRIHPLITYTPPQKYEWDEFIRMKSPYNLGQSK